MICLLSLAECQGICVTGKAGEEGICTAKVSRECSCAAAGRTGECSSTGAGKNADGRGKQSVCPSSELVLVLYLFSYVDFCGVME